jgi:peroxiredoxin
MEPQNTDSTPAPVSPLGLAITSLVLGILSLVLSFLVLGGVLGLMGLILGITHLVKQRRPAGMARWGIALSILSLIASLGFAVLYYRTYQQFTKLMQSGSQAGQVDFAKWEGVKAPDISLTTLDGRTVKLSDLKGKRVVLDFWATWCPPCREEIPHFIELYNQTSRDTLAIVGISDEDVKTLQNFVKKNGVNYPIASAKNLPAPYSDIQAIPTTFFLDRQRVIQAVVVGYHEYNDLKSKALATDFQGQPKPAPTNAAALPDAQTRLKPVLLWSANIPGAQAMCVGDWADRGNAQVLVAAGSALHVIDLTGAEISSTPLPDSFTLIECGRNKEKGPRLLGYSNWGRKVSVVDKTGKELWDVSAFFGVDGAHWGDLNGDGTDEMVAGMNGGGGLQAWSSDGKQLWAVALGNVWNQAIVPATTEQPARIFATEAGGTVKVFDAQGNLLNSLRPDGGYYAQMSAGRTGDKTVQVIAINDNRTMVFDDTGSVTWTTSAQKSPGGWRSCNFAAGSVEGHAVLNWAFIDGSGSLVIANSHGQKLASIPNEKKVVAFAFAPRQGQNEALITLHHGLVEAFSFQP